MQLSRVDLGIFKLDLKILDQCSFRVTENSYWKKALDCTISSNGIFLNYRLSIQPFVRISFAQGFDQVEELENPPLSYACDIPLRDVSYPYLGLQYRFRL